MTRRESFEALAPVPLECIRKEGGSRLALSAELLAQGERIGMLGQLAPAFARALDAIKPVLVGEIALEKLRAIRLPVFHDIPKFPAVVRDIAVVCPIALPYGDLETELWNAKEKFLVRIEPFDIYTGSLRRKTARQSQIDRDLLDIPRAGEDAEQRGSQRCLRPLEAAVEGKAGSGFPGIVLSKILVRRKAKTPICPVVFAIERRKLPNCKSNHPGGLAGRRNDMPSLEVSAPCGGHPPLLRERDMRRNGTCGAKFPTACFIEAGRFFFHEPRGKFPRGVGLQRVRVTSS